MSQCKCVMSKTKCPICQNVYDTKIPNFKCPVHRENFKGTTCPRCKN